MKKVLKITEWNIAKLMFNEDRRRIINTCAVSSKSIKELSTILKLNPGSIFNHVKQLENGGYLEIVERRFINGIEEKKYLRTAEFFDLSNVRKQDLDIRNKYIIKDLGHYILEILENDELGPVQHEDVRLNEEDYAEALKRYRDLMKFMQERNGSGDMRCSYIGAMGKILENDSKK